MEVGSQPAGSLFLLLLLLLLLGIALLLSGLSALTTFLLGSEFAFWTGFRDVVVFFAEGAAGAAGGEPGVDASRVEGVAAGEAADVVVVFDRVETDGAGVARVHEEVEINRVIVIIVVFIHIVMFFGVVGVFSRNPRGG